MPEWLIVVAAVVALALVAVAVAILYSRLAPSETLAHSVGLSLACAGVGMLAWFACVPFFSVPSFTDLTIPLGPLGGVAALVATCAPRALGAGTVASLIFAGAWSLVVYVPVALAIFVTGVAGIVPVDHGGSLALNVAAGAAALGVLVAPGRRSVVAAEIRVPRGLGSGAVVALVVGWVGWLVAAELAITQLSLDVIVNALVAAAGGVAGWLAVQRIRHQTTTLAAVAAGLVSGLVAITAGAPLVSPVAAASFGVIAGGLACILTLRRVQASGRGQWFIVGTHLVAAAAGIVLLGLLATGTGFAFTGQIVFIQDQLLSTAAVAGYSAVVALLLWMVVSRLPRVP